MASASPFARCSITATTFPSIAPPGAQSARVYSFRQLGWPLHWPSLFLLARQVIVYPISPTSRSVVQQGQSSVDDLAIERRVCLFLGRFEVPAGLLHNPRPAIQLAERRV